MKTNQLLKTFLAGFLMTLCGVLTSYAQWAKLNPNELSLAVGETKSVTVEFEEGYTETSVTWTFLGRTSVVNRVDEGTENAKTIEIKALAEGETFVACEVHGKKGSQTRTQSFVCNVNVTATAPTALSLPAGMTVKPGKTLLLTPTVTPEGASTANLTWASSDKAIATVSAGVVTGVKPGTVQITVQTEDGSVSATCDVTVTAVDPTAISLPAKLEVKQGKTETLTPTVTPTGASVENLLWSSSNGVVASVTSAGVVKGVKVGTATITVKTTNGLTATCEVTVLAPDATSITLPLTIQSVKQGETLTLTPTLHPSSASTEGLTWTSSDEAIATVSKGDVKGVAEGTVTITVTTANGLSATCKVKVLPPDPTAVKLPTETQEVKQGATLKLTPTFEPANATTESLTWTSSNTEVATVSSTGVVTGVKANDAEVTITVTTANGKTATCKVKVVAPDPTSISLPTTQEVKQGETITLDPTLKPEGASATLTWTSNNSAIASIADATKGEVKGVKEGSATITVKTANGLSAYCVVTVLPPDPTKITLPTETQEVKQGETLTLSPTLEPEGALAENLTWTSDNEAVATVTSSGVVKGVKASDTEVTITVTTANGKSATCKVKVVAPDPTTVSLPASQEVKKGESLTLTPEYTPSNATSTLTWSSSDDAIATVTSEGKVEGKEVGTATIKVETANGKSATCQVRVVLPDLTDITLPTETQEVKQGETLDLTTLWTLTPADASTANLEWSSSDTEVATVTSSGVVKGVKAGDTEVTITVKTKDGSISKECKVKVVAPDPVSVSLPTTLKVKNGDSQTLTPEFAPSNATSTLTWESSDDAIATVSSEGKVEGKAEGTATIKVTTANGKTASCLVTVVPADPVDPTTITLPTETQEVKQGETLDLTEKWTLDPADASTANLVWTSSDETIVTVANGVVTGVKANDNEVTISVKVNGSTEEAKTCKVKVLPPDPTFVSLPTTEKVKKGEKLTLTPSVKPSDASTEDFEWTSNKEEIATVSKGEVTGVAEGVATITVKTPNGLTSFCVVTVIPADPVDPTAITLPTETQEVKQGETLDLTEKWTLDPTEASTANLEWSSSDETIATVSEGVVTGVKADDSEVTITVKVKGSDVSLATCKVKVTAPELASISLPETQEVKKDETLDLASELTLTPENAPAPTVTWTSDDEAVATVSAAGVVTGKSVGTAKITAKVSDEIFAECEVTVVAPDLTKIELPATVKMCIGDTKDLAAELTKTPEDAETPKITWATSDKNVARVAASGLVIALNLGTATITATTEDGLTAQCQVIVSEDPDIAALDNALYVEDANLKADASSFELPVLLKNDVTAVGASFTLTLPEGMTLATDEDGDVTAQLNDGRAAAADFNVLATGANGSYNVSVMPKGTTEAFSGTDGKLLTFTVNVPEGVEVGSYTVRLTSSMLTVKADDGTLSTLELANTSATLNVVPALAGDVNNDGTVDVTDATMIVYAALGEEQEGFDSSSADVNQDGRVDLTDAIIVLYQSLGEDPLTSKSSRHNAATYYNDGLVINDVVIEKGGLVELPVKFVNPQGDKIVGLQMTLVLPEGVSTVKDEEELPMVVLDGTSCPKMSLYPTSNDAFGLIPTTLNASVKGTEGTLFTTTLRADNTLESGSVLETRVTGAVFSIKDATGTHSVPVADFTFSIIVGDGADAITDIAGVQENNEARYSLSGQRVGNGYKGIIVTNGRKVIVK